MADEFLWRGFDFGNSPDTQGIAGEDSQGGFFGFVGRGGFALISSLCNVLWF